MEKHHDTHTTTAAAAHNDDSSIVAAHALQREIRQTQTTEKGLAYLRDELSLEPATPFNASFDDAEEAAAHIERPSTIGRISTHGRLSLFAPDRFGTVLAPEGGIGITFTQPLRKILLVTRIMTPHVAEVAMVLTLWLEDLFPETTVYMEKNNYQDLVPFNPVRVGIWDPTHSAKRKTSTRMFDLVIVLGGDGSVLWVSTLFPTIVPPIIAVSMGSLGYLSQFTPDEMIGKIESVMDLQPFSIDLRCRIQALVYQKDERGGEFIQTQTFQAVNEFVVDRGNQPTLVGVDVYIGDKFLTTVQADGLIISTPTGSTAYSMAAGGSIVHPRVGGTLFTPICPHALSMRPLLLPDDAEIKIMNRRDSRSSVYLSADGRLRVPIASGEYIVIKASEYPFPLVMSETRDWFQALTSGLQWNYRSVIQKPVTTVPGTDGQDPDEFEDKDTPSLSINEPLLPFQPGGDDEAKTAPEIRNFPGRDRRFILQDEGGGAAAAAAIPTAPSDESTPIDVPLDKKATIINSELLKRKMALPKSLNTWWMRRLAREKDRINNSTDGGSTCR